MRGWSPVIAFIVYNLFSISRTCGGDPIIFIYKHKDVSYFPHMRGWSYTKVIDGRTNEVFPAHAGVILRQGGWIDKSIGISRTCGGDPLCRNSTLHCGQYFPHMRGWSSGLQTLPKSSAVFPAHAGVILPKPNITLLSLCISRTCGGDPRQLRNSFTFDVYFPHMRGWSYVLSLLLSTILGISRTCGGDPHWT